jgi:hypothetical protein
VGQKDTRGKKQEQRGKKGQKGEWGKNKREKHGKKTKQKRNRWHHSDGAAHIGNKTRKNQRETIKVRSRGKQRNTKGGLKNT